jgi:hypothetical protein
LPRTGSDENTLRALALALPETSERPCYGTPGFYVRKKLFARLLDDGKTVAVRCDFEERDALLEAAPEVFQLTPHYLNYPMVLARLPAIGRRDLHERLVEAWRFVAPPKLRSSTKASDSLRTLRE